MYSLKQGLFPSMIEDWSEVLLNELETLFIEIANQHHVQLINVYLVGSLVFGRDLVNDIDVCVHTKNRYSNEQERVFRKAINTNVQARLDVKFRYDWSEKYQRCDLGFIVPYYDLFARKLIAKAPRDTMNFHFSYGQNNEGVIDTSLLIAYDRFKGRRVMNLIAMHEKIVNTYKNLT